jgi:hypothetical protein
MLSEGVMSHWALQISDKHQPSPLPVVPAVLAGKLGSNSNTCTVVTMAHVFGIHQALYRMQA